MKFTELLKISSEALLKNKIRSLLTMLGIIIGVAAVIVMISISAGTEATITEQITSLGSNLLYVRQNMTRGGFMSMRSMSKQQLVYDDAWAIAKINGVAGVVVEQDSSETVKGGTTTLSSISILGTSPDFPSVRDMTVASGKFFTMTQLDTKAKVAILGSDIAQQLFPNSNPVGQTITIGNTRLGVIGVMAAKGTTSGTDYDTTIFIPITTLFQKFNFDPFAKIMGDTVRQVVVEMSSSADSATVQQQILLLLAKRHSVQVSDDKYAISTQQDIISTRESTTASFRTLLSWVAGVSLIVGGIGIMNIMMVSVTERTREIGLRQAIGATPNDIRLQFLTEAMLLSLLGGLIGVLSGIAGAWIYGSVSSMRTVIVPSSILLSFASAAAVGVFFGFYPANKASQLDPIEALRYE
jgi:putative ABC transport system permease protein